MKKSIRIGDGIAEFFGTHDGNIKYLESLLKVQVHIDDDNLTIDGADEQVQLVERLIADYAAAAVRRREVFQRRSEVDHPDHFGRHDPESARRRFHGKTDSAGKRTSRRRR